MYDKQPVWYVHAEKDTPKCAKGDWFIDTGQDAQCASAHPNSDGSWTVHLNFEVSGKPLSEWTRTFASIDDVKAFVADYYDGPVEDMDPNDLLPPEVYT
jgi:hypothetical protein